MRKNRNNYPVFLRKSEQYSIENSVFCYGIGVHSGKNTQLTLKPAKPGSGIIFVRTDVKNSDNFIVISEDKVFDTSMSTCVKNESGVSVSTVEHLTAALWGCGIDNVIAELDGPEVPIMDGSSKPFVLMIEIAGKKKQLARRKYIKILKEVSVEAGDSIIVAEPSDILTIDSTIDFGDNIIGSQNLLFSESDSFIDDISEARTFGFAKDLDILRTRGLAKGAGLDNSIGIDQGGIMNPEGLRHEKEFVKHKTLDLIGDLYTSGFGIVGSISAYKTGHTLNNLFLRKLLSDKSAYSYV